MEKTKISVEMMVFHHPVLGKLSQEGQGAEKLASPAASGRIGGRSVRPGLSGVGEVLPPPTSSVSSFLGPDTHCRQLYALDGGGPRPEEGGGGQGGALNLMPRCFQGCGTTGDSLGVSTDDLQSTLEAGL